MLHIPTIITKATNTGPCTYYYKGVLHKTAGVGIITIIMIIIIIIRKLHNHGIFPY